MFCGCTSLNYVSCFTTDIGSTTWISHWLNEVSETGTFVKAKGVDWPSGDSGIPEGWTVTIDG